MAIIGAVPVILIAAGAGVVAVAGVLFALVVAFLCSRWQQRQRRRLQLEPSPSSAVAVAATSAAADEDSDVNRPLISDYDTYPGQITLTGGTVEKSRIQIDTSVDLPTVRAHSGSIQVKDSSIQDGSQLVPVKNDSSEDSPLSATLKRIPAVSLSLPDGKASRISAKKGGNSVVDSSANGRATSYYDSTTHRTGSSLALEVIGGPAQGQSCARQSSSMSKRPLTLGRVPPNDMVLRDSEVSGKHALINWNATSSKWELVDVGSLNGTFLNSLPIHRPDEGSRTRSSSEPAELSDGDIITLGSSSKVSVRIIQKKKQQVPSGFGMAFDPMIVRGKNLPMEDVAVCQYPLQGLEEFGLFAIFDGHGGAEAAKSASRLLPEYIAKLISHPETKERILSSSDASDVLKNAFTLTDAAMDGHEYEGCTATILLIWMDSGKHYFAQCANLGDSACVMNLNGMLINMTEDHRVVSPSERARVSMLSPLREGETRIHGLNICRMLGDKFLKEQDVRFSAEPYVSKAVKITEACAAVALMASDGLWDVLSSRKALQIALQSKESKECSAERIARNVLDEARRLRTKDNTSVICVDFGSLRIGPTPPV